MTEAGCLTLKKQRSVLHELRLFEPQVLVFSLKRSCKVQMSDIFTFLIPHFTTCSSWMDPALAAYFAVNNACWDLVRRFGKRNCAKWKKGMCFSADERQIRRGKHTHQSEQWDSRSKHAKVKENTVEITGESLPMKPS